MIPLSLILAQLLFGNIRLIADSSSVRWTEDVPVPSGAYTESAFESYLLRLSGAMDEAGYWYHQIRLVTVFVDSSEALIHIDIEVDAGEPVVSSFLRLEGNRRFATAQVSRLIPSSDGHVLTGNRMRALRRDLLSTGLYRTVSEPEIVFSDGRDGVLIRVEEVPPGSVDGVLGSNQGTVVGSLELTLRNALAIGHRFDLRFDRSRPLESTLDVTTSWSRIRSGPFSLESGFHLFQQDSTFLVRRLASAVDLSDLRGRSIGYWVEWRTSYAGTVPPTDFVEGDRITSGIRYRSITLNDAFFPTEGHQLRFKAGTGRRKGGRLSSMESDWEVALSGGMRSAWTLRGAAGIGIADTIRIDERFRYGGAGSFRGIAERRFETDRFAWTELERRYRLDRDTYGFVFTGGTLRRNEATLMNAGFGFAYLTRIGLLSFTAASTSEAWGSPVIHVRVTTGI